MTAYNREQYIAEAIESVLASSYTNFELIIVDDGSSDRTVEIAKRFEQDDARIRVYLNEKNLGDYPNRNKAASYAKGELLVYVDSDDTIFPDSLEYIVNSFQKKPSVSYATIYHGNDFPDNAVLSSEQAIRYHFYKHGLLHFGPGGTVVKRDFFQLIGCFPEKYGPANDMYYNVKAACYSPVLLLRYEYLHYREHAGQENKNTFGYLYTTYLYYQDFMQLPELPLTETERKRLLLKSKRRFLVNSFQYLLTTRNVKQTIIAYRLAGFGLKDMWQGLFHI